MTDLYLFFHRLFLTFFHSGIMAETAGDIRNSQWEMSFSGWTLPGKVMGKQTNPVELRIMKWYGCVQAE